MRDMVKIPEWKKPSEKLQEKLEKRKAEWLALSEEEREKKPLYKWYAKTITNILTNEKYIGDSISGKTYKVDVLSKKRVINNGESAKFHNLNTHEGIITRETIRYGSGRISKAERTSGSYKNGKGKI